MVASSPASVALSALVAAITGLAEPPVAPRLARRLSSLLAAWRNPQPASRASSGTGCPLLVILAGYDLVRSRAPDLLTRATSSRSSGSTRSSFGTAPTVRLQDALVDRATPHWYDYPAWLMYLVTFRVHAAIALVAVPAPPRIGSTGTRSSSSRCSLCRLRHLLHLPAVPPWLASQHGALAAHDRIVHAIWAELGLTGCGEDLRRRREATRSRSARFPRLHAAWPFMIVAASSGEDRARGAWCIVAYTLRWSFALVYTAEHFVFDILVGWLYAVARLPRRDEYPRPTRQPSDRVARGAACVTPLVRYERDGHVATITYNRPEKLNAINGALRRRPQRGVGALPGRRRRVGGDRHRRGPGLLRRRRPRTTARGSAGTWPGSFWEIPTVNSFESGLEVWKPTIAAVNGYCLGYGLTRSVARATS